MLEGIRILSFTHYLQGPLTVQLLADLGADVIKIEPPKGAHERYAAPMNLVYGNNMSISHIDRNRNQRSLAVDLKSEKGLELVHRLVDGADVIVENFRPGVLAKYGLGYDQLKDRYPKLVYCSITGWGADGPYRSRPGQDLLAQGVSGFAFGNGLAGEAPMVSGVPIMDTMGAMTAAYGVLGAIVDSVRNGRGHFVDSNLLNAAIMMLSDAYPLYFAAGKKCFRRLDTGTASRFYATPYGAYATADGHLLFGHPSLDILKNVFGAALWDGFVPDDLLDRREEVDAIVAREMKKKTTDQWIAILEKEKNVWFSRLLTYDEVAEDPQVIHNGMFMELDHPQTGKQTVVANPIRYDGERPPVRRLPPLLGEHSREIMAECGYSESEIDAAIAKGSVVCTGMES